MTSLLNHLLCMVLGFRAGKGACHNPLFFFFGYLSLVRVWDKEVWERAHLDAGQDSGEWW